MKFDKSFFKSKTLWTALIVIVGGFLPDVKEHLTEENSAIIISGLGAVFGLLRLTTKKELVIKEDKKVL